MRVFLLGQARIEVGDRAIERFRTKATFELLAFLLSSTVRPHSRDELVSRFWEEDSEESGRQKLRLALHSIKTQLGPILSSDRLTVQVTMPESNWVDRNEFQTLSRVDNRIEEAVALYRGPFMPGYSNEWVVNERNHLENLHTALLLKKCESLLACNQPSRASELAAKIVQREPYSIPGHLALLRSLEIQGRHGAIDSHLDWAELLFSQIGSSVPQALYSFRAKPSGPKNGHRHTLIGREDLLSRVLELLGSGQRALVLWGRAGIGKTAVAKEIRQSLLPDLPKALFLSFGSPSDYAGFLARIGKAVGSENGSESAVKRALKLAPKALLILDNLESVSESASNFIDWIIKHSPQIQLLITSQRRLEIQECVTVEIPPLGLPAANATLVDLLLSESCRLLFSRLSFRSGELTDTERSAAVTLCTRLEGNPLALELASEWLELMSPSAVLTEFERTGRRLKRRHRRPGKKHSSLESAIETSLGLLKHERLATLKLLAGFKRGFSIETASIVCEGTEFVQSLSELEQRALVCIERTENQDRYRILETIKATLLGLCSNSEIEQVRSKHASLWFRVGREWLDTDGPLINRYADEVDDISAATAYLLETDLPKGIEMVLSFVNLWQDAGRWDLWEKYLREGIDRSPSHPSPELADLYNRLGSFGYFASKPDVAKSGFTRRKEIYESLDDRVGVARATVNLALVAQGEGRALDAITMYRSALLEFESSGADDLQKTTIVTRHNLSCALLSIGDGKEGVPLMERVIAQSSDAGFRPLVALSFKELGCYLWLAGKSEQGLAFLERSLEIFEQLKEATRIFEVTGELACALARADRHADALSCLQTLVGYVSGQIATNNFAKAAEAGAFVAFALQDYRASSLLLAATKAFEKRTMLEPWQIRQVARGALALQTAEALSAPVAKEYSLIGSTFDFHDVRRHLFRLLSPSVPVGDYAMNA